MSNVLPQQPTIYDVAKAADLSKSTVSAALLDDHRVSPKTREYVRLVAKKIGYTRNAFAANLATRGQIVDARSLDVAIVSHVPLGAGYEFYHCTAIRKRFGELGYQSHHYDVVHDKISGEKLRTLFLNRGYCGVIFHDINESSSEIFSVDWSPFSLVGTGRTYGKYSWDLIRNDVFKSVSLAWQEIRRKGYRRIGFAFYRHQPVVLDDSEREASLWICQQNLLPGEEAVPPCLGSVGDKAFFKKWFRHHRPDVVVGFNRTHYIWLCEMGLRIPQDVAYANLHYSTSDGAVAGVDQSSDEIQIKAAEHLDFLVRHKRIGIPERPWEMLGSVRWIPAESLPVIS